jgi:hypothetical protein
MHDRGPLAFALRRTRGLGSNITASSARACPPPCCAADDGMTIAIDTAVPANLSRPALQNWAADHPDEVICNFDMRIAPGSAIAPVLESVPCNGGRRGFKAAPGTPTPTASHAQVEQARA